MNKVLLTLTIMLSTLFAQCQSSPRNYQSVEAEEFYNFINGNEDIVVLDVRTAEEYSDGHLKNAINIDVKSPDFAEKAMSMLPKGKTIAVYCRSGRRSKIASEILSKSEYNIIELNSGYLGWTAAGKEVSK